MFLRDVTGSELKLGSVVHHRSWFRIIVLSLCVEREKDREENNKWM